jgi:hypothetical protein
MLDELRKSVHDLTADPNEVTSPEGISMQPGDPICQPVLTERARRKAVDEVFSKRLGIVARQTQITMWGVFIIIGFAGLEYLGILGHQGPPTWARAVFDGIALISGGF